MKGNCKCEDLVSQIAARVAWSGIMLTLYCDNVTCQFSANDESAEKEAKINFFPSVTTPMDYLGKKFCPTDHKTLISISK